MQDLDRRYKGIGPSTCKMLKKLYDGTTSQISQAAETAAGAIRSYLPLSITALITHEPIPDSRTAECKNEENNNTSTYQSLSSGTGRR